MTTDNITYCERIIVLQYNLQHLIGIDMGDEDIKTLSHSHPSRITKRIPLPPISKRSIF